MTTIAWDGLVLAADKQVSYGSARSMVTKIYRVTDGLVGFAGNGAHAMELLAWFNAGRDPDKFPSPRDRDAGWADILQVRRDGTLWFYRSSPYPAQLHDRFFATGSGGDFATAAMFLGRTAQQAIEVASRFDVYTGMGIDTLSL